MNGKNLSIIAVVAAVIVVILALTFVYGGDDHRDGQTNGHSPIELTFTIDETKLKVVWGDKEIKDKDVVTFTGDATLTATTLDGQRHTIAYGGSWENDAGEKGSGSGSELTSSASIYISNHLFFGKATGTMSISCLGGE